MQDRRPHRPKLSFWKSLNVSIHGVLLHFKTERNGQIQLVAGGLVVLFATYFRPSPMEWAVLVMTIGVVLAAEAFNTAVERLVDLVSPEWEDRAGQVKDLSSGAVLITCVMAILVGLCILGPKLWRALFG